MLVFGVLAGELADVGGASAAANMRGGDWGARGGGGDVGFGGEVGLVGPGFVGPGFVGGVTIVCTWPKSTLAKL